MKKTAIFHTIMIAGAICFMATFLPGNGKAEILSTLNTSPVRIAFNGNGDLLVSDYVYGQVLTIAPDTLDITGELNINGRPLGVAWANGLTYVGNSTSKQVEVYNSFGQEQFVLGFGNTPVISPQDIAIAAGKAYVVDGGEKVVKVFTQDGFYDGTIPHTGYDRDVLANPTAIAVDETNQKIYVSDYGDLAANSKIHPRIQVFGFDGALLYSIGSGETNKYRFTMPQGLTLNGNHQLYVIDSLSGEIHIFDATNGNALSKVKGSGRDSGVFAVKMPLDLVIDSTTNKIFVTNNMMASINVFAGAGGQ